MPLDTGTRFGPYEILTPIGVGGMGEVYRAKDTRLKREVALKVLPESFARDRERMDRFQREAEVLASLNHPNIATIYGVEERALAMELVEGETLRGPLPVDTALSYARQIAEALEYAHDRRVIHRDLKPANVKVTPEGVVKLLDFGLAKAIADPGAMPEDVGNSPTLTRDATRTGVILGTAAYMSPEQANGRPVDPRSDIFSFGSVLYEMLTGQQVFTGESVSDTLASVLKLEPDWDALPTETPEAIVRLLRRCLTKDRKQRLQAIGEARIVLEAPKSAEVAPSPSQRASRLPWIVVSALALVAAVALWGWLKPVAPERRSVLRFEDTNVAVARVAGTVIALSRDGTRMAFIGGPEQRIYVRLMDQLDAKPLPGTEDSSSPCFSPDGDWISYISGKRSATSQLKRFDLPVDHLTLSPLLHRW
jgi:serine/threonine-protein kinase